jgi:hypothetical protein
MWYGYFKAFISNMYILLAEFTPARLSIGPVLWEVIRSIQLAVTWTNSRKTGQVLWIQLPRTAFLE